MKLSIITINYNNLAGLKKTVDSVLSQTWRDFEWIIVDGGSTDGSKEYIETLAQSLSEGMAIDRVQWNVERFSLLGFTAEDLNENTFESVPDQSSNRTSPIVHRQSTIANPPQRLLWCSEPDKGVYNAMNKGIVMAQGEFLNFMNSGDCFFSNNTLSQVFDSLIDSDIIYGNCNFVDSNRANFVCYPSQLSLGYLFKETICHQASFIKTSLLKETGYREDLMLVSDWERYLVWFVRGCRFVYIDKVLANYDVGGMSSDSALLKKEKESIITTFIHDNPQCCAKELVSLQSKYDILNCYEARQAARLSRRGHMRQHVLTLLLRLFERIDNHYCT